MCRKTYYTTIRYRAKFADGCIVDYRLLADIGVIFNRHLVDSCVTVDSRLLGYLAVIVHKREHGNSLVEQAMLEPADYKTEFSDDEHIISRQS